MLFVLCEVHAVALHSHRSHVAHCLYMVWH